MAEQRPGESREGSPVQETSRQVRDTAHEIGAQVSETAQHVSAAASEYYEQGSEKSGEFEHYLEDTIRAKPVQSVLLAAGVGMLLALLWKR
jgi:ElaB/YqjD/DUF883 family membrane-anchored ribosome-binding protein